MDENWKQLSEFTKQYKDTLVIDFDKVVVLRGLVNGEDDYYWILQKMNGDFCEASCVGEVVPLKTHIYKESYERLKSIFQCNLNRLNREIL